MKGKVKVLENIYPITTIEAVKVGDGTSKSLKDMIDNNELGNGSIVSTEGRGMCCFALRSGEINVSIRINNESGSSILDYTFNNGDYDRLRRLFVYTPSGTLKSIDIPDGTLEYHQALIYNVSSNTLRTVSTQWGSTSCTAEDYVLLFNANNKLSGLLSSYCKYGDDNEGFPIKNISVDDYSVTGSTQGIFVMDGQVYTSYHAPDDHSDFSGGIGGKSHNICHMNSLDYNDVKDMLIVGNGSKSYVLQMKGWIFPNWKNTFTTNTQLDINVIDKIELDFSQYADEYKAQLCWGDPSSDIVFLATSDCRIIRKLQLNKTNDVYDGTYTVLDTWKSRTIDIIGGMMYSDGYLYFGVKGSYGIRKCILKHNGYFDSEYIEILNKVGDMQGIHMYNNEIYAYTDTRGYKFDKAKI